MAKIPDFSEFTKKLGIDGIMDSVKEGVKSVMGGSSSSKGVEADEIVAKFAELAILVQALSKHHAEFGKLVTEVQQKFDGLTKEVQAFRAAAQSSVESIKKVIDSEVEKTQKATKATKAKASKTAKSSKGETPEK